MASIDHNETLLLQEVFGVSLSNDNSEKYVSLPGLISELSSYPGSNFIKIDLKSLSEKPTIIDTLVTERIAIPQTCILPYLMTAFKIAEDEKDKPWYKDNQSIQSLISNFKNVMFFLIKSITTFAVLNLQCPEFFPEQEFTSHYMDIENRSLIS